MRTARPAFFWAVVAAAYSAPTAHSFSGVGLSSAVSAFVSPLHQQRAAGAADAGGAAGAVRMSAVVEPGSFGGNYMPTFGGFAGGSTAAPSVAAAPSAYSVNSPLVDRIAPAMFVWRDELVVRTQGPVAMFAPEGFARTIGKFEGRLIRVRL